MDSLEAARLCAEIAFDKKCDNVLLLDVRDHTVLADYFLIATAKNRRQLKAVTDSLSREIRQAGLSPRKAEGVSGGRWLLLDLGDVVVHLFDADARAFYDLESMWADALRVHVTPANKPATKTSTRGS